MKQLPEEWKGIIKEFKKVVLVRKNGVQFMTRTGTGSNIGCYGFNNCS